MYENQNTSRSTSEHAPLAAEPGNTSTRRTDPKFARESFTMRRMKAWQVVALAVAAAVVIGLVVFYI